MNAKLGSLISEFQKFLKTDEGEKWKREIIDRKKLYQKILNITHIDNLTTEEFSQIIKSLWASNIWTNKDWLVQKILEENGGLINIRNALREFLDLKRRLLGDER